MPEPEKRVPGQSNADYGRAQRDPNAEFLGTQSLVGGGDPTWVRRAAKALFTWRKRPPR